MKPPLKTNQSLKKDWGQFNGPAFIVSLMRSVDPSFRSKLIAGLRERSKLLADLVDRTEFIYSDLARVEASCLDRLWAVVSENEMAIAWKMTEEPLKKHLLTGLSTRRQQEFAEACSRQPKVHRRQVIRIQQTVAAKVRDQLCRGFLRLTSLRYGQSI